MKFINNLRGQHGPKVVFDTTYYLQKLGLQASILFGNFPNLGVPVLGPPQKG